MLMTAGRKQEVLPVTSFLLSQKKDFIQSTGTNGIHKSGKI
jgi:hypothetical protein